MNEQFYYGHGKLLLSGEYFVLNGAKSLALPTKLGQKMHVSYRPSNEPKLFWKSYDVQGECWFETSFELWHINCLEENANNRETLILQKILIQARKQNIHFLRDEMDVYVETTLEFPRGWGLGSSSTLIYNIAQWAYIGPFELQAKTFEGSGYDIACAQSMGPISYQLKSQGPHWETLSFSPHFKDQLYFVYLNKKQSSPDEVRKYKDTKIENKEFLIKRLNSLTEAMMSAVDLGEFEEIILEHESLISEAMDFPKVRDLYFSDFWGATKSLGAWGGDFILATSSRTYEETKQYFARRGYTTILKFDELILQNFQKLGHIADGKELESLDAQLL